MPFQPKPVQPDFAPLYTSLANSKTQKENNALYQTIFLLIRQVTQSRDLLVDDVNTLNTTISAILQATILTVNDESHLFFNSRQELAGSGIAFDDTIPHKRTISAYPSISSTIAANALYDTPPEFDVYEIEPYGTLVNSTFGGGTPGPAGPAGSQGNAGPPGLDFDNEYIEPLMYQGPAGAVGASGSTGAQGNQGPPGQDGEAEYIEPIMYQSTGAASTPVVDVFTEFAWFMGS